MNKKSTGLWISTCTFCALTVCFLTHSIAQETPSRFFSGVVETLDGRKLPDTKIEITGLGETLTSEVGQFSLSIPTRLRGGDPVEISVGNGKIIVLPWKGKSFVSVSNNESIRIRAAEKGDPKLLSDPKFLRQLVIDITSFLSFNVASGMDAQSLTTEEVRKFGFSFEQVSPAIQNWIKNAQTPYDKGLASLYQQHYAEAAQYLEQTPEHCDCDEVERLISIANAEWKLGHHSQVEAVLTKARQLRPEDPDVLFSLARALTRQGKYSQSEDVYQALEVISERAFGPQSLKMAFALRGHGLLYEDQARYGEAESLFKRVLAIDEKEVGTDDPLLMIDLGNLAMVYSEEGKYAEAESLYKKIN